MPRSAQPEIAVRLQSYRLPVPEFAPVFEWLHRYANLTNEQIAGAFRIKPGRVRSIRSRRSADTNSDSGLQFFAQPLIVILSPEVRESLGISSMPDDVVLSRAELRDIDRFAHEIETDQQQYASAGRFEDGLLRMRMHIRRLGQPHSAIRIGLLARLRHHSAWFLVHMGRTQSAIDQAQRSMLLSATAFHESDEALDCERMAETGLVLSNAYLLRNGPSHALRILEVVRTIKREFGWDAGPEYYRQRGTAQMLLGADDAARASFFKSAVAMKRLGADDKTVFLWGSRQSSILGQPDWDRAQEVFKVSTMGLSKNELPYQMSAHWALATALATGEEGAADDAFAELGPAPSPYFGHQATIRYLLELTPRLQLKGETLFRWLRFAMYSNVFRDI